MTTLYGLTGYKGSGKSEAARYLESKGYIRHNFKDALVDEMQSVWWSSIILNVLGLFYSMSIDELFAKKPPLMRRFMQWYGSDFRRKRDQGYWVRAWKSEYIDLYPYPVVADDCRFLNEAWAIKKYGGKIIRIVRSDIKSGGTHVSETEMDQIVPDYTVEVEYGDLEGMYTQLQAILNGDN